MENAGGEGVTGVSGEGRMDWKEGKERERDGDNRWEGWGMDAVIWRCMHHRLCHLTREDRPT